MKLKDTLLCLDCDEVIAMPAAECTACSSACLWPLGKFIEPEEPVGSPYLSASDWREIWESRLEVSR